MKKYHLISGMPRSGTTLFTALLNQNPRFHSAPTSMLLVLFEDMYYRINKTKHGALLDTEKRTNLLKGLFESYYKDCDKEVCFNTNRAWTSMRHIIPTIDKNMKYICFVREIPLILNSFEKAYLRNPLYLSAIYDMESASHNLASDRCDHIYTSKIIPQLKTIDEIIRSDYKNNFMFIEYEQLCANPTETLRKFYEFIEEPFFDHDFNNVGVEYKTYDIIDNNPDLHTTEQVLRNERARIVVPNVILDKYNFGKYWIA